MSKPSTVIIASVLFVLVLTVFSSMVNIGVSDYNQTVDDSYSDYFDEAEGYSNRQNETVTDLSNSLKDADNPIEAAGILITGGVWSGLMLLFDGLTTSISLVSATNSIIPGGGLSLVIGALILLGTIVFLSMMYGRLFGKDI